MSKSTTTNNPLPQENSESNKQHPINGGLIRILPEEVISKISAGEVVERPASVLKELIENSLDAGATAITIEIEGAGKKLIRVSDDGEGIPASDITRALEKHATSKITSYEDLFHLKTMGFRGEALSSIGAVSEIKIESVYKQPGSRGAGVKMSFGKITATFPSAIQKGTSVEITGLFFNTPARMKFLKSDATEKNFMLQVVQATALAHPEVAFEVFYDKKNILHLAASKNTDERIREILKEEVFSKTIPIKSSTISGGTPLNIEGRISAINSFISSRNMQYLFVNGRYVYSRAISKAIYDGLKGVLPTNKHPIFIIYLTIAPEMIDVNISPTKKEIKFSNESALYQTVFLMVKKLFSISAPAEYVLGNEKTSATHLATDIASSYQPVKSRLSDISSSIRNGGGRGDSASLVNQQLFYKLQGKGIASQTEVDAHLSLMDELRHPRIRFIGELFGGYYLLASDEENFYIIDAHAASERILYEKYKQSAEGQTPTQLLLSPIVINLPPLEFEGVAKNISRLNRLGWQVEVFGENSIRCEGTPACLGEINPSSILNEIFSGDDEDNSTDAYKNVFSDDYIIKKSCHAAVRGKEKLSFVEAQRLVNDLFNTPSYQTCPHGRPTVIHLKRDEILKKFGRK